VPSQASSGAAPAPRPHSPPRSRAPGRALALVSQTQTQTSQKLSQTQTQTSQTQTDPQFRPSHTQTDVPRAQRGARGGGALVPRSHVAATPPRGALGGRPCPPHQVSPPPPAPRPLRPPSAPPTAPPRSRGKTKMKPPPSWLVEGADPAARGQAARRRGALGLHEDLRLAGPQACARRPARPEPSRRGRGTQADWLTQYRARSSTLLPRGPAAAPAEASSGGRYRSVDTRAGARRASRRSGAGRIVTIA
jgi:hypothetical protein